MESLVHYKRLILKNHSTSLQSGEREALIASCTQLLSELQVLDPERKQRYVELGTYFDQDIHVCATTPFTAGSTIKG